MTTANAASPESPPLPARPYWLGDLWIVAGLVLISLAVRWVQFNDRTLWYDEVLSWHSAIVPLGEIVESVKRLENTPPGYFLVLNLWVKVFGDSDAAMRAPSLIFSVASIAALYWLGATAFNRRAGLLAAILMTFCRFHVWYAQEARTYSLLVLLAILSTGSFVHLIQSRGPRLSWRWATLYVLSSAFALYAHPFIIFTFLAQNLAFALHFVRFRNQTLPLKMWIALQVATALLFVPWLQLTLDVARVGLPWMRENASPWESYIAFAGSAPAAIGVAVVVLSGAIYALRCRQSAASSSVDDRATMLVLVALATLCPVIAPLAASWWLDDPIYVARYGLAALPMMMLLAGWGLAQLPNATQVLATLILVTLFGFGLAPGYYERTGLYLAPDVRSAARVFHAEATPGDRLIFQDNDLRFVMEKYIKSGSFPAISLSEMSTGSADSGFTQSWLIAQPRLTPETRKMLEELGMEFVSRWPLDRIEVVQLHHRAPTTSPTMQPAPR